MDAPPSFFYRRSCFLLFLHMLLVQIDAIHHLPLILVIELQIVLADPESYHLRYRLEKGFLYLQLRTCLAGGYHIRNGDAVPYCPKLATVLVTSSSPFYLPVSAEDEIGDIPLVRILHFLPLDGGDCPHLV